MKLGRYLASNHYNLITGACSGLISFLQNIFDEYGMDVIIMEVSCYKKDNYKYKFYNHNTIGDRKYAIIYNSDLLIFLPGGIGTLDEIFTAIESRRALEHNKDIIIINSFGYYNDLITMLDTMYKNNFASDEFKNLYYIFDSADEAIKYIDSR